MKEPAYCIPKRTSVGQLSKDTINKNLRQGVFYSIPCHNCDQRYIGETTEPSSGSRQ